MGYRDNILERVEKDRDHPLWKGVKMQAHHLISKAGLVASTLKADFEHLGYDINVWENLVMLPCTLQGACHLGVQLHRGNHNAVAEIDIFHGNDDDSDWYHLPNHAVVAGLLEGLRQELNRGILCDDTAIEIQKEVNQVSLRILRMIKVFAVPLTAMHFQFTPALPKLKLKLGSGCCGCDTIPSARDKLKAAKKARQKLSCPTGRSHLRNQGPGQVKENITYSSVLYDHDIGI